MSLVEVKDLRKEFDVRHGISKGKSITAVDGLNFEIAAGEVFGLLGPNGAGKSTTVKMISTLITPTSGDALIDGCSVVKSPEKVRSRIGVMLAGERNMYWKLTGRENLVYFSTLYHVDPKVSKQRIESLLDLVGLTGSANRRVESYSTGMKIRLSFAKSLLNDAPVVLLDEPTMSIDPQASIVVRDAIVNLKKKGKAILLTTHNMDEADRLCDRVGIIDHGTLIACGTPSELKRAYREKFTLRIKLRNSNGVANTLERIAGVESVVVIPSSDIESHVEVTAKSDGGQELISSVLGKLMEDKMEVESFEVVDPTLEDVFIRLTGRTLRD